MEARKRKRTRKPAQLGGSWPLFDRLVPALFWLSLLASFISHGFFYYFWLEFSYLALSVGFAALAVAVKAYSVAVGGAR